MYILREERDCYCLLFIANQKTKNFIDTVVGTMRFFRYVSNNELKGSALVNFYALHNAFPAV